jgi:hypothetical protein
MVFHSTITLTISPSAQTCPVVAGLAGAYRPGGACPVLPAALAVRLVAPGGTNVGSRPTGSPPTASSSARAGKRRPRTPAPSTSRSSSTTPLSRRRSTRPWSRARRPSTSSSGRADRPAAPRPVRGAAPASGGNLTLGPRPERLKWAESGRRPNVRFRMEDRATLLRRLLLVAERLVDHALFLGG